MGKNHLRERMELARIPHHSKEPENLPSSSSSSPALLTTAFSGFEVLSKPKPKAALTGWLLHVGREGLTLLFITFRHEKH